MNCEMNNLSFSNKIVDTYLQDMSKAQLKEILEDKGDFKADLSMCFERTLHNNRIKLDVFCGMSKYCGL